MPSAPIPESQVQAFNRAICERLGLDPAIIEQSGFKADWETAGRLGKVSLSFDVYLPAEEILAMFNAADSPREEA